MTEDISAEDAPFVWLWLHSETYLRLPHVQCPRCDEPRYTICREERDDGRTEQQMLCKHCGYETLWDEVDETDHTDAFRSIDDLKTSPIAEERASWYAVE